MFTDLEIKVTTSKCYVEFYLDGTRQRIYSGAKLGLNLFPNRAKTDNSKLKLLTKLEYEIRKALEKGWSPVDTAPTLPKELTIVRHLETVLKSKLESGYSRTYRRDLSSMVEKLLKFLTPVERSRPYSELASSRIVEFLEQFNTSNTNYTTKRKTLNVLLGTTTKSTASKKPVEVLHEVYTKEQLHKVLQFLKENYPKLHLMALLTYGCLLRPHEEIRLLTVKNFQDDTIVLSGAQNKGKRIRIVPIPIYIKEWLEPYLQRNDVSCNIFTGMSKPYNTHYFGTQWARAKKKMQVLGLLQENQTIYSFRHTAAVNMYLKSKNILLVQRMLGHSSVTVTLKYLRGVGQIDLEELRDAVPDL